MNNKQEADAPEEVDRGHAEDVDAELEDEEQSYDEQGNEGQEGAAS